jgi:ribosomal protein S18 acetylase RimI-like enzyme
MPLGFVGKDVSNDLAIRITGAADLESVGALVAAFRDHLKAETPTDAELARELPDVVGDPSIEFACAFSEGEALGYTQTRFYRSLWAPGIEALLEDLFVIPAARGRGVGRALLRHALVRARARGARLLGLTTNERNEAAQSLYRAEGLRPQAAKLWVDGREIRWVVELGDA